jgi:Mrp family chromosome partitioning ATPase
MVDAVVLVVRAGKTTAAAAEMVISTLQWAGANMLGVVLNQVRDREEGPYYGDVYGYGRGQGYGYQSAATTQG